MIRFSIGLVPSMGFVTNKFSTLAILEAIAFAFAMSVDEAHAITLTSR